MFFLRVIQWLLGYVRFSADGGYPEKFLNLASSNGLMLWNIGKRGTSIEASTLCRNYKKLRAPAQQAGVTLRVIKLHGLRFKLGRFRKRQGLIAGVLFFFAAIFFFSSFIWTVEITGNSEVSTAEITQALSELGLRPGAFPALINTDKIEHDMLIRLPELSNVIININGSEARVKVYERIGGLEVVPEDTPCNIKAACDGQIVKLETYVGRPMLRTGDTIRKGQIIISGVVVDRDGAVTFMHASGKAIARTRHTLSATVPYHQQVDVDTGEVYKKRTLQIFNLHIPLFFKEPEGHFKRAVYNAPLRVFGKVLPFSVTTRVYTGQKTEQAVLTETQAADKAREELEAKAAIELSGATILSSATEFKTDENGYTLYGHYACEEDIAYEEAIQIS